MSRADLEGSVGPDARDKHIWPLSPEERDAATALVATGGFENSSALAGRS